HGPLDDGSAALPADPAHDFIAFGEVLKVATALAYGPPAYVADAGGHHPRGEPGNMAETEIFSGNPCEFRLGRRAGQIGKGRPAIDPDILVIVADIGGDEKIAVFGEGPAVINRD